MESGSEDQPRLTGAERGKLRSLAQTLDPKVFVGKAGVNAGIAKLLEEAFRNADLVKVRFTAERDEMEKQAQELAHGLQRGPQPLVLGEEGQNVLPEHEQRPVGTADRSLGAMRSLSLGANAVLNEPVTPDPVRSKIVIINTHPEHANNLGNSPLTAYGYRTMGVNYYGPETTYEEFLLPLRYLDHDDPYDRSWRRAT